MISLDWQSMDGDIKDLMSKFGELPRWIAKKHLQAAMKRVLKDGVPILKKNTPPLGRSGRGRKKIGAR